MEDRSPLVEVAGGLLTHTAANALTAAGAAAHLPYAADSGDLLKPYLDYCNSCYELEDCEYSGGF